MKREKPFWEKPVILLIVTLTLSFIIFGQSLNNDFFGDDNTVVNGREDLRSLKNIPEYFTTSAYPGRASIRIYRPLTLTSYALNFSISQKPFGFHAVNIILHALNAILVFIISRRILGGKKALLVMFLFLLLPIHAEAVVPVVGRSEVLSIFFVLLSLLYFLKEKYWLSSLFLFASLLSKDFAIFILPLLGVLLLLEKRNLVMVVKSIFYYVPTFLIYALLRFLTLGEYAFGKANFNFVTAPLTALDFKERLLTAFLNLWLYIRKTFFPVDLSPDYSFNQIPAVNNLFSSAGAIVGILLLIGLIYLVWRGQKPVKFAAILFLVPWFFVSNIIITSGSFAERWMYFPSIGLLILLVVAADWFLGKLPKFKLPFLVLFLAVLFWYGFLTLRHGSLWNNEKEFYIKTASLSPQSVWAKTNLAAVYIFDKKYDAARSELEETMEIHDRYPLALDLLGELRWQAGEYEMASDLFLRAIENDAGSNLRNLHRLLAFLNLDFGYGGEAVKHMEEALNLPPTFGSKNVAEVDKVLFDFVKDFAKTPKSRYNQKQKDELARLVKLVRGF